MMRRRALVLAAAGGVVGGMPGAVRAAAAAKPDSAAAGPDYRLTRQAVGRIPDVKLLTMRRRSTTLARELDTDAPLWLNFIFTTCSTTCPMQTAVLAALHGRLRREGQPARFLSLTIDPDDDTPEQLVSFASKFGIGDGVGWQFCTGKFDDLLEPQKTFDVYRGSKVAHPPVVLLRTTREAPWWRISGFPTPEHLHAVLLEKRRA